MTKIPWGAKEDELLKEIMRANGSVSWTIVADKLNLVNRDMQRTGKQCRERWRNHLDPELKRCVEIRDNQGREAWEEEEDVILLDAHVKHGNKWKEITRLLQGRSENAVKNRYNILYKKHRDEMPQSKLNNVSLALQAVSEVKKDDTEWIQRIIAEKKEKIKGCLRVIEV